MAGFTEKAIKDALWALLDERPLSQIRVKDIVERCGVNRNTFYYHFSDIPSLLEGMVMEQAGKIIDTYPTLDSLRDCVYAVIHFAEEHRRAVMHIYNSTNRAIYEQYLWEVCEYVVTKYMDTALEGRRIPQAFRQGIISQYKCECFGVVMGWMNSGMDPLARELIDQLWEIRQDGVVEMLDRLEAVAAEKGDA